MGALMFGGYRFFDNFWRLQGVGDYSWPAVAGLSVGTLCGLAATPLEQVKTVLALQHSWLQGRGGVTMSKPAFTSIPQGVLTSSVRFQLYACTPLMIRTGLFDLQLFFYSARIRHYMNRSGKDFPDWVHFAVNTFGFMLAGMVGATINYPFDLVKGRMMAEAYPSVYMGKPKRGTLKVFSDVVQQEGLVGLFRGLPTRTALHAVVWLCVGLGRET